MNTSYEKYKKTEYDWLGDIPSHWNIHSIRSLTKLSDKRRGNSNGYELLSVYREYGVVKKSSRDDNHNVESLDLSNYKIVNSGDLVMNKMKMWQGSLGISQYNGIVSPAYIVCKITNEDLNFKYIHYLLRSAMFKTFYNRISYGVRVGQWDMRYDDFKSLKIYLPPSKEQDQIVRYLDWKLSKINKLIRSKKKQIALLYEHKQAIIDSVVINGLDLDGPMNYSGVEWIGNIPKSWEICRCKYLFTEVNHRSQTGDETHLSMSQKFGLIPDDQLQERRMLSESYIGGKVCQVDDLVLNRLKAHLGVFALAPQKGVISPDYTVLRPNKKMILPKYAEHVLKSSCCRKELRIRVRGVVEGFWRLYTDDFGTINLPLPPKSTQRKIINYISKIEIDHNRAISSLKNEILFLREYRNCLISDVITGKLDVRDINISEYEDAEDIDKEEEESITDEDIVETED